MNQLLSMFSGQAPLPGAQEGLPFWIFWFLLSIILLLVIFIFLRDKDLRRRINLFLFRTKQNIFRLRLEKNLKKERKKITEVYRDMGEKAWKESIPVGDDQGLPEKLKQLELKRKSLRESIQSTEKKMQDLTTNHDETVRLLDVELATWEEKRAPFISEEEKAEAAKKITESEIQALQKSLAKAERSLRTAQKIRRELDTDTKMLTEEKVVKEKELSRRIEGDEHQIKDIDERQPRLKDRQRELDESLKRVRDTLKKHNTSIQELTEKKRNQIHKHQRESKEWEKEKEKIEQKIAEIKKQKSPLFEKLGALLDTERPESDDLTLFFSQIDRINTRIGDLEKQIAGLSGVSP
ncbi:MAG: hypothetical protein MUP70_11200 [Candidatus Aminicenantes bacterium]|nr:hypothetical protein [Candidatus Aminicenantes bacterium]